MSGLFRVADWTTTNDPFSVVSCAHIFLAANSSLATFTRYDRWLHRRGVTDVTFECVMQVLIQASRDIHFKILRAFCISLPTTNLFLKVVQSLITYYLSCFHSLLMAIQCKLHVTGCMFGSTTISNKIA